MHDGVRNAALALAVVGATIVGFVATAIALRAPRYLRRDAGAPATEVASAARDSGPPATVPPPPRKNYNVVLLTIDTLRHDLGWTGYPRPVTPNLDALAKRSTV